MEWWVREAVHDSVKQGFSACMQRCGIESVVLEARDRVGGRVYGYSGSGFSVPVDLGASIITGTATDVAKGLRPDPSAVIARWACLNQWNTLNWLFFISDVNFVHIHY